MNRRDFHLSPMSRSRRGFLKAGAFGLGSVALPWLLQRDGLLAAPVRPELQASQYDLKAKQPPGQGKAKAMISLFMIGGPSQMDLFDPKPLLTKYHLQKFPGEVKYDNAAQASNKVFGSPWKFSPRGQCGMELSELLPHLGEIADDICLVRSMHTDVNNHGQSLFALQTGRITAGRPTIGSWLTYGLGSETQELPAYVALSHPEGMPLLHGENWTSGWLPSLFQGTHVRPTEPRILNLDPPDHLKGRPQARQLELLKKFNEEHAAAHPVDLDLQARLASYELAAHMQTSAREALDISGEPESIKKMYGIDQPATKDYGTRCLIARRLVERGVRFVQVFNQGQSWDQHSVLASALPALCAATDKPVAALVKDLKQRGLLDSTVVHWGGEMGRLPVLQNDGPANGWGRDHNTYGFSMWLAGGGFKGGYVHGATDEWGHRSVVDSVSHSDYHATLLHLFGIDHRQLIYRHNGLAASLTDGQAAQIVTKLLA